MSTRHDIMVIVTQLLRVADCSEPLSYLHNPFFPSYPLEAIDYGWADGRGMDIYESITEHFYAQPVCIKAEGTRLVAVAGRRSKSTASDCGHI